MEWINSEISEDTSVKITLFDKVGAESLVKKTFWINKYKIEV